MSSEKLDLLETVSSELIGASDMSITLPDNSEKHSVGSVYTADEELSNEDDDDDDEVRRGLKHVHAGNQVTHRLKQLDDRMERPSETQTAAIQIHAQVEKTCSMLL